MVETAQLNADCRAGKLDRTALQQAMQEQGSDWAALVAERCPYLFSDSALFITNAQLQQMHAVVAAVERVVKRPGWMMAGTAKSAAQSVFFGYDFHLSPQGVQLIEINTNAGGGFLVALLLNSQRNVDLPGKLAAVENLEQVFLDMFRNEWRLERGDAALRTIAIIDEQPETQYLYPEFLLAKAMFDRAGITAYIVAPEQLQGDADGVYLGKQRIDLVYNRLTDFTLQRYPALQQAYIHGSVVLTPHPHAHVKYADKRNLVRLTDVPGLQLLGIDEMDIDVLLAGIPHTIAVHPDMEANLWAERKQWFFKPTHGYAGRGAYRGANLTRRVFGEIMQSDYVAQKLVAPSERAVCMEEVESTLKVDVRCYVYNGQVQLVAARLYQGQTTNFRTPGGGFSLVSVAK